MKNGWRYVGGRLGQERGVRARRHLRGEALESRCLFAGDLAITEINYNPTDPTTAELAGGTLASNPFEYVEIKNIGDAPLNLTNYRFTVGIAVTLGNVTLSPGQIGVIVRDGAGFQRRYGAGRNVIGQFTSGSLDNAGERLTMVDAAGTQLFDFEYDDLGLWPTRPDGGGASLELVNPNGTDRALYDKYYSWRASTETNGSPGLENRGQMPVVINEVLSHTDEPTLDSIELHNTSNAPVNIGGWYLSDSNGSPFKFQIPAGTVIPAGGYYVADEDDFNPNHPNPPGPNEFRLSSSSGDDVWLTIGTPATGVTSVVDTVTFDGALNSVSFGRVPNGQGRLFPTSRLTLGCSNGNARIGPLVISEVNYNPGAATPATLAILPTVTGNNLEFVELHNPTSQPYSLEKWRIRGAVDFDFAATTSLGPGATLVIVSFDPALPANAAILSAFRTQYGIGPSVTLAGPYTGNLSNSADRVTLQFHDTPPVDDTTITPRIVADEIVYDDRNAWPSQPDGAGPTLQRVAPTFHGGTASSWRAANPTPGAVTFTGSVPFDLNGDGVANAGDIDYLFDVTAYPNHIPAPPVVQVGPLTMDFDSSFNVNAGDVTAYLAAAFRTRFGDANLDGFVDGSDFNRWNENRFQLCNKSWGEGDFTGDGVVDTEDFNRWQLNRFRSGPVGAALPAERARTPRMASGLESASPVEVGSSLSGTIGMPWAVSAKGSSQETKVRDIHVSDVALARTADIESVARPQRLRPAGSLRRPMAQISAKISVDAVDEIAAEFGQYGSLPALRTFTTRS